MSISKRIEFAGTRVVKRLPSLYSAGAALLGLGDDLMLAISEFRDSPLLLVYQQGRVASTSVYESIAEARPGMPVLHLHTIRPRNADRMIEMDRAAGIPPRRNWILGRKVGLSLERRRRRGGPARPWKVVTSFRDPIAIMLSLKFMNPAMQHPIAMGGKPSQEAVLQYVRESMERDDPSGWNVAEWFDTVFAKELGIDPYATPIDHDLGYTVIRSKEFDVLLLKYEGLESSLAPGMAALLEHELPGLRLKRANVHRNYALDGVQSYVKTRLRLSEAFCDRAYGTRFMQHFYGDEDRARLRRKWTGQTLDGSQALGGGGRRR